MSKWDIEETLKEADGEYISREEVCTDCLDLLPRLKIVGILLSD